MQSLVRLGEAIREITTSIEEAMPYSEGSLPRDMRPWCNSLTYSGGLNASGDWHRSSMPHRNQYACSALCLSVTYHKGSPLSGHGTPIVFSKRLAQKSKS